MALSSSATRTLSGLFIPVPGLIPSSCANSCVRPWHSHLEAIRDTRPPSLCPECSGALSQVKVSVVCSHFQFSYYEAILRGGLPGKLIGVPINGLGPKRREVLPPVDLANPKPQSTEPQVAVILVGTEIAVKQRLRECAMGVPISQHRCEVRVSDPTPQFHTLSLSAI